MKKIILAILGLVLFAGSVLAISIYANQDFKGISNIQNVTNITFKDGTIMTTAPSGFSGNMTGRNLTDVDCIIFVSGGMACSG